MALDAQYTIHAFLWNNADGSDKVWGYFALSSDSQTFYNFWGRRGKKLTWKEYQGRFGYPAALVQLRRQKIKKGYQEVAIDQIETSTPGFTEEFEKNFTLARLFDNFHGKQEDVT